MILDHCVMNWLIGLSAAWCSAGASPAGPATQAGQHASPAPSNTTNPKNVSPKPKSSRARSTGRSTQLTLQGQDFELNVDDDVQIRVQQPRQAYDEKGQSKKCTELKQMKGPDATIPGYPADFADLKPGQVVTLYLLERVEAADEDQTPKKPSLKAKEKSSGQLIGTIVRADEKKRKLKIHVQSATLKGSARNRVAAKDAGSALLAYHRISAIVIATNGPPGK